MNPVSKLIFDHLASGRNVNFPEVGSLYIERDSAEFTTRNQIRPPQNRVVFSRNLRGDSDSIIGLIMAAEGVNCEEAVVKYNQLLDQAKTERGVIEFADIGVIKHDFFYPSALLYDTLNPAGGEPVKLKRTNIRTKAVIIPTAIALGAIVAAILLVSLPKRAGQGSKGKPSAEKIAMLKDLAGDNGGSGSALGAAVASEIAVPSKIEDMSAEDVIQQNLEQYGKDAPGAAGIGVTGDIKEKSDDAAVSGKSSSEKSPSETAASEAVQCISSGKSQSTTSPEAADSKAAATEKSSAKTGSSVKPTGKAAASGKASASNKSADSNSSSGKSVGSDSSSKKSTRSSISSGKTSASNKSADGNSSSEKPVGNDSSSKKSTRSKTSSGKSTGGNTSAGESPSKAPKSVTPAKPANNAATGKSAGKTTTSVKTAQASPAAPIYYVVAGVFANESNADKLISRDPFLIGEKAYDKHPFKGKTMVTVFASKGQEAANRRRRQLRNFDSKIWIYADKGDN